MDSIVYNKLNSMDISNYIEHQASNLAVNSASLTTLMSVTGKGMLEEALLSLSSTPTTTTQPEIKITVDGNVILDLAQAIGSPGATSLFGIYPTQDLFYGSSTYNIAGTENVLGSLIGFSAVNLQTVTFPNSAQVVKPASQVAAIVGIEQPIYFNESLLIQVQGVATSGTIKACAKARY